MEVFANILKERFGENEPILIGEILEEFSGISRQAVYKKIDAAMAEGSLERYDRGVYYLPTETRFGKSRVSARQVAAKRWLQSGDEIFGYVSGFNLANESGVSAQVPNTLEITTNKEKMRVRDVKPFGGWKRVTLRRPRRPVNARNVDALRFLDLITAESIQFFDEYEMDALRRLARKAGRTMIYDCSASYPGRTAKKLAECERYRVFA
ncbi:hypothetical protein [uncultured Adlercreutzia sp.]|uniref:hypothetical protein n=1 Tax=uncultured Adlercreutzia sp. TaxID=875803 RepID=UPI002675016B|nr:hypothetical protein [uncultured Adlercreutzia sp.]